MEPGKFPKERSDLLNQTKLEKMRKKKKKKEEDLKRLRAKREAQKKGGEIPRVPGLNRTIVKAMLGLEESIEEKPKEEEEEPKEIICPPTPTKIENLSKKRKKIIKEEIRGGDLGEKWREARSDLIEKRNAEFMDWVIRIPHDTEPEVAREKVLQIKKELEENYNKEYAAKIAAINNEEKPLIVRFYSVGGQGPKLTLPPIILPEEQFKHLFRGDIKKIEEEKRKKMEEEEKRKKKEEEEDEEGEEENQKMKEKEKDGKKENMKNLKKNGMRCIKTINFMLS